MRESRLMCQRHCRETGADGMHACGIRPRISPFAEPQARSFQQQGAAKCSLLAGVSAPAQYPGPLSDGRVL